MPSRGIGSRRCELYNVNTPLLTHGHCGVNVCKIIVAVPPGIANVSDDQVACEGSLVTLSCNATGNPTPNISWTKVEDNGTDSAPLLPAMDGKYVMSNIQRSAHGTYRCTADNGVGAPVNRTVKVKVECKSHTFYVVSKKRSKVVWKKKKTPVTLVVLRLQNSRFFPQNQ